jgi:type IV pilus assembly protein PilA
VATHHPSIARGATRMTDRNRITRQDEDGFTLIELMVVVLIIAILIAIAIPTFLGAQDRARDRGTQSDLRNALTAAKVAATDHGGLFFDPDGNELGADDFPELEPAIDVHDTVASTLQMLIVTATGGESVTFVQQSASSTFFGISSDSDGNIAYCRGVAQDDCDDPADAAYEPSW